jgi:predicted PurR-regulated permease PerM
MPEAQPRRTALEIPWRTIFKILAAVALVWLWLQLYQFFLVIIVAILLAVTLHPVVAWFERRGWPRSAATSLISLALVALIAGFVWMTWSSLNEQVQYVSQHFGNLEQDVLSKLPPWMRDAVNGESAQNLTSRVAPYALQVARSAANALVVTVLGFILTVYLLVEGPTTYDWLIAFVPKRRRARVERTLAECETVVFGYVTGAVVSATFATVFVLVWMSILKVPAALVLALLAGMFDFIPVLGFIASSVPAIVLAMTVSNGTALAVAALYVIYHAIETYFIVPRVYGNRLKLSHLAVILAFAIGAEIAGVIGAIIALPVAAIYPSIERIWLREELPPETVEAHRAIEHKRAG